MKRFMLCLAAVVVGLPLMMSVPGCGQKSPVAPDVQSNGQPEYRVIRVSPELEVRVHRSIPDSSTFMVFVGDSTSREAKPTQALASWQDGTRIRYGWDSDRDFYIDYRTPRSCCYRISYTYALYYALRAAGKPLIVYATGVNPDGTINWHIIIGASVLRYISPALDWFLAYQAKMQYYL
ncbi:MAG: hypothetical protein AAB402_04950 [Patescibacteria group bacterium]